MKKYFIILFTLIVSLSLQAQDSERELTNLNTEISEIDALLKKNKSLVTKRSFNQIFSKYQYQLGGEGLKDGRSVSQNATLSDKELTFNFAIRPTSNKRFFIQPKLNLQNKDGFIAIFNNEKLNNIYTGGINFVIIPKYSFGFTQLTKNTLHNGLKLSRLEYEKTLLSDKEKYVKLINETKQLFFSGLEPDKQIIAYFNAEPIEVATLNMEIKTKIDFIKKNFEQLIKLKLVSANIANNTAQDIINILETIKERQLQIALKSKYVSITDSLQQKVLVNKDLHWISFGLDYSMGSQKILNDTALKAPTDYLNEYVTLKATYNYQHFRSGSYNFYVAATVSFSSNRDFRKDSLKTVNTETSFTTGAFSGKEVKTNSFYTYIPKRLNTVNLETPIVLFYPKKKYGLELTPRFGINNIDDDNLGLKFGVFIPVGIDDKSNTIMIQPLLNFNKLFRNKTDQFWKDNFSFGFNLSISLPKLIKSE